jgi:hypothetical protein
MTFPAQKSKMLKINCQKCARYHDCPRMKGGQVCYGMRPAPETPAPAQDMPAQLPEGSEDMAYFLEDSSTILCGPAASK